MSGPPPDVSSGTTTRFAVFLGGWHSAPSRPRRSRGRFTPIWSALPPGGMADWVCVGSRTLLDASRLARPLGVVASRLASGSTLSPGRARRFATRFRFDALLGTGSSLRDSLPVRRSPRGGLVASRLASGSTLSPGRGRRFATRFRFDALLGAGSSLRDSLQVRRSPRAGTGSGGTPPVPVPSHPTLANGLPGSRRGQAPAVLGRCLLRC